MSRDVMCRDVMSFDRCAQTGTLSEKTQHTHTHTHHSVLADNDDDNDDDDVDTGVLQRYFAVLDIVHGDNQE